MQVANLDREWHAELPPPATAKESWASTRAKCTPYATPKLVDLDPDLYGELIGGLGGEK